MIGRFLAACLLTMAAVVPVKADVTASLEWCWNDFSAPASAAAWATPMPDDNSLRGPMSAHDVLVRAIGLAKKVERPDVAVRVAAICQQHNESAYDEIIASPNTTIDWLRAH